ncbi:IMP dehydrogenase [Enterobacter hormaechei]
MRIEEDLKLGFKDVLIRPKRSTLKSRSDVELERQFTFKHSGQTWSGVPIIAANMDTVGTFEMATALAQFDILTAVHKHYSAEEWDAFVASASMPGDVAKAFGGGADFVMLGGMLAGHEESGGTVVEENGEKFMLFYGMSSESAMTRHVGGVAKYRAAEGKTVKLPLRGPVENTARDILGGLRSACTYVGASRLKELTKRTTFIRVQEQENRVFNSL